MTPTIRSAAPPQARSPRLQDDLEQQDDTADDETGEDRDHEQPSAQAGVPACQADPEAERKRLQPDDPADRIDERDIRKTKNEQNNERWDGEQEKPRLKARHDEPLPHRRPSAELHQLDDAAREDVGCADRDNRSDDDENDVDRLQGGPTVIDDQDADQGDRRCDDTADDRGPRRQVERVVRHSG